MTRVQIGDAVLYHGDCLEILPTLDPVGGCVIMDPPFGMNYESGHATDALWSERKIKGDSTTEVRDFALAWAEGLPVLCFGTWKAERPAGTKIVLIWDKGGALGMGDLSLPWKADHEEIYVLGKGFVGSRDCGSVLRCPPVQSMAKNGREHPNQKPVALLHELIRKTDGVIRDPFMGSGSCGVAAVQAGRPFIGIERDERYFDIAVRRITQAVAQGQLFAAPRPDAEQVNLFAEAP
jgi:DNA modification methylase